jgi:hypothetical protein
MKRYLTLPILALALPVLAGSGGPDAYGYTWKDNFEPDGPVFSWIDITGTGIQVTGLGDDNVVGPFVMQTNFEYYWYNRKFLWIGSNGYIAFNNGNIASPFPTIPVAGGTNDYITGIMADLNFSGAGNPAQCWLYDDELVTIVSYLNVPFWSQFAPTYTGSNTFQIIMDKQDSTITVQILQQSGLTQNNDITIGIESVAGSIGLLHSKNVYPQGNYAIRYTRPGTPLTNVTDAAVRWNTDPGNGGLFLSRNGAAFPMRALVANIGSTAIPSFTATGAILNAANQVLVTAPQAVPTLIQSQEELVQYGTVFQPTTAGTFRMRTTLSGVANDLVAANNQLIQELVVVDTTTVTHDLRFHGATDDGLGLSWSGGNGGVGVQMIPPYYPAQVTHLTTRIVNTLGTAGCFLRLYDDDGPGGTPGTLLGEVFLPPAQATVGDKAVALPTPVLITEGSVYVQWYMAGENIAIARDANPPFSLRTFEVLDNVWAEYRDRENTDFFLGLRLTQVPIIDVGVTSFFEPTDGSALGSPTTVRVFVRNFGNQAIGNFPVSYRFGTQPVVTQNYPQAIQPGAQALVSFAQPINPNDNLTGALCAWTSLGTDLNAANDTTCITITLTTGVGDASEARMRVYPNPAQGQVWIDGLPAGEQRWELFDATGALVRAGRATTDGSALPLALDDMPTGLYHLHLLHGTVRLRTPLAVLR